MWQQIRRIRQRAIWSWDGFVHVYRTEGSFMQWIVANVVFGVLAFVLPLSAGERALLLMGGIMVLAAECMNTAIERVVDDISTERRDAARQAKDCGSAAVAVTGVAVGVGWVPREHFWRVIKMAKANEVDLSTALDEGQIDIEAYADMIERCRGCSAVAACDRLLDENAQVNAAPAYCRNSRTFAELKAGS